MRVFVTGVGLAEGASRAADAIPLLRSGYWPRTTIGYVGSNECLYLESGRVPPADALAELLGFAQTVDQPQIKRDLQPARALRRALADGRMNAVDIGYACAFELGVVEQARALAALERGLGRFAANTRLEAAADPAGRCVRQVARENGGVRAAVALVIGPGSDAIALAFARP